MRKLLCVLALALAVMFPTMSRAQVATPPTRDHALVLAAAGLHYAVIAFAVLPRG